MTDELERCLAENKTLQQHQKRNEELQDELEAERAAHQATQAELERLRYVVDEYKEELDYLRRLDTGPKLFGQPQPISNDAARAEQGEGAE